MRFFRLFWQFWVDPNSQFYIIFTFFSPSQHFTILFSKINLTIEIGSQGIVWWFFGSLTNDGVSQMHNKNTLKVELVMTVISEHFLISLVDDLGWKVDQLFEYFVHMIFPFNVDFAINYHLQLLFLCQNRTPVFVKPNHILFAFKILPCRVLTETYIWQKFNYSFSFQHKILEADNWEWVAHHGITITLSGHVRITVLW